MMRRLVRVTCLLALVTTALGGAQWFGSPSAAAKAWRTDRVRKIVPIAFRRTMQGCDGGSAELTVHVRPSMDGELRIGIIEDRFFGHGDMERAAYWMAGILAGLVTRRPMNWRIVYQHRGYIDGPSAGGLMTVAVLSAVLDQPLLPRVTMTGTINPDGTIGRVGGVYYKLLAAKRAGMKTVLIPAGMKWERKCGRPRKGYMFTGARVDLFERAKSLGLKLIPVRDVHEAYFHMTGRPLPQELDFHQKLKLPRKARQSLTSSYETWGRRYQRRLKALQSLTPKVFFKYRPGFQTLARVAESRLAKGREALRQGKLCAGLGMVFQAASLVGRGELLARLRIAYGQGGVSAMIGVYKRHQVTSAVLMKSFQKLAKLPVKNLNDLITLAEAYAYTATAYGVSWQASQQMALVSKTKKDDQKVFLILRSAAMTLIARDLLHFSEDLIKMGMGYWGPPVPPLKRLAGWSWAMTKAAEANIGYFDRVFINAMANKYGRSPKAVRLIIMLRDLQYMLGRLCAVASRAAAARLPKGVHQSAVILGGTATSFALTSLVVAKWTKLDARLDKSGALVKLGSPQFLKPMLRSARRHLRESILRAQKMGFQAVVPIFHLRVAEALAGPENPIADRLWALSEYWVGTLFGRLMTALAEPEKKAAR
ncbi:MAG: hypothetical protein KJ621_07980 [Proteobacteria bacterium]|nr:hypothetical protein [Pseudomonadota bacterium]MBU1741474.1 hypothetical protein [Pseudomonadota bacterium]